MSVMDGAVNPYVMLSNNFDPRLVDTDIDVFDSKKHGDKNLKKTMVSNTSIDMISNFTYDKDCHAL